MVAATAGGAGDAEFTVRYLDGGDEVVRADSLVFDGSWARFVLDGAEVSAVPSDVVLRIDRTAAPAAVAPKAPATVVRRIGGALLLLTGGLALWVGLVDAFTGATTGARLSGVVFAVLGAAASLGAEALRPRKGGKDPLNRALVGAMALLGLGLLLVVVQISAQTRRGLIAVWCGLALAGIALVGALWRAGGRPNLPKAVQGFVAASVIVGLFQFWYTNEYVPASREPGLTVKVDLAKAAAAAGQPGQAAPPDVPLTAEITVRNVSKSKVRFIGARYQLYTDRLVEDGELIGVGGWLEPDQDVVVTKVLLAPKSAARIAYFDVEVNVGKGSRFGIDPRPVLCPEAVDLRDCAGATRSWRVIEPSLLNRLLRGDRYVSQRIAADDRLTTCVSAHAAGCDAAMSGVYGNSRVTASDQLLL